MKLVVEDKKGIISDDVCRQFYQNFLKGIGFYIAIYNLKQELLIPGTK